MDVDAILNRKNEIVETLKDNLELNQLLPNDREELQAELDEILELETEIGSLEEVARNGGYFIDADYFADYAQELANDIGAIDNTYDWPLNCIDWEQAADELRMDYTEVEFQGSEYLIRL